MLRTVFEDQKRSGAKQEQAFSRDLNELTQFVRAGRLHSVSSHSLRCPGLRARPIELDIPFESIEILTFLNSASGDGFTGTPHPIQPPPRTLHRRPSSSHRQTSRIAKSYGIHQEFGKGWALKDNGDGEER